MSTSSDSRPAAGHDVQPRLLHRLDSIVLVLGLAAAIHLDWHLARPQLSRLSLDWSYHWLFGVVTFGASAWYVTWRWPARLWSASALHISLAVVLGQVLEPLAQSVAFGSPLVRGARWTAFAEFLAAGLMTYLLVVAWVEWRRGAGS